MNGRGTDFYDFDRENVVLKRTGPVTKAKIPLFQSKNAVIISRTLSSAYIDSATIFR